MKRPILLLSLLLALLLPGQGIAGSPTTGILDTFTGTNGDDLEVYSANWTALVGTLEIQGSAATGLAAQTGYYAWDATTFGPNPEAHAPWNTLGANDEILGLLIRLTTLDIGTVDGYFAIWKSLTGASNDTLEIAKIVNGVPGAALASTTFEATAGDQMFFEGIGTTLTIYINGTQRLQTTDSDYGAAGYIGLVIENATSRVTEFGGGTVVAGGAETTGFYKRRLQ